MAAIDVNLENLDLIFPEDFTEEEKARAKTLFLKRLSLSAHQFYGGKIQTVPKVPVPGFNWFNVWYSPGVSKVSTEIRDDHDMSFKLSNRGNLVAVISDSTRVLGDGDCTPAGGLGVMEGKAFLMKYLGGCDGVALCVDSKDATGKNNPDKIIDFVKMCQHSFGAVNLEDISQPNCFRVLDELRDACDIPVWHDDAQGTACVTLAGLLNALKLAKKKLSEVKIVLYGAGASITTIARLLITDGANPDTIIMFDSKGTLNKGREDIKADKRFYRKWELCETTNKAQIKTIEEAMRGADVLISASTPGPDTIKKEWVSLMAPKAVVFACANPVPEIWPFAAKEAGAFIVATGRGDFPNQVNNSVGFPGILKGALMVRAKKITDGMAIRAAHSIADFSEKRGITPDNIIATMQEAELFPHVAADVAQAAVSEGVARVALTHEEAYKTAKDDIDHSRALIDSLSGNGFIKQPPAEMMQEALEWTVSRIRKSEAR
jgi:malate dehydrogenase (oxaloacetate-decarboxylating)